MAGDREQASSGESAAHPSALGVSFALGPRFEERYLRAPAPLHFPVEEELPEGKRHLELRALLYRADAEVHRADAEAAKRRIRELEDLLVRRA